MSEPAATEKSDPVGPITSKVVIITATNWCVLNSILPLAVICVVVIVSKYEPAGRAMQIAYFLTATRERTANSGAVLPEMLL